MKSLIIKPFYSAGYSWLSISVLIVFMVTGLSLNAQTVGIYITDADAAEINGLANGNSGTFQVRLSEPSLSDTDIDILVDQGVSTAGANTDRTPISGAITILAGDTTVDVVVGVLDDSVVEGNEILKVDIVNVSGVYTIDPSNNSKTLTILDDDFAALTIADASATEGQGLNFNISANAAVQYDYDVIVTFQDVTAQGGPIPLDGNEDYRNTAQTITFTAGSISQNFTVPTANDVVVENNETFSLSLSANNPNVVTSDTAIGTIVDNDTGNITVEDITENEGDRLRFRVTNNVQVPNPFTVTVNFLDVSATGGNIDYDSAQQILSFNGNAEEGRDVDVDTNDDNIVEGNETFIVNLTSSDPIVDDSDTAVGTIIDDDVASISIGDVSLTEGNSGTKAFNFTVSIDGGANAVSDIGFSYNTANGTANLADADYIQVSGGSGTITTGTNSTTVTVLVNGDTNVEATENFFVNLGAPVNATLGDAQGQGSIVNDDVATISINDVSLTEGNSGTKAFNFTVSIDGGANAVSDIGFAYSTANGTATIANTDYVQVSGGSGTISSGTNSTTVTVLVNGDTAVEATENFFVNLSAPVNATISDPQGLGTITNDDTSTISINDPTPVNEGNTGTSTINFTVSIDASSPATDITVDYLISGGNEDGTSGNLTFVAGTTTLSQQVPVTTNGDTGVEADEDVSVALSNPSANALISATNNVGTSSFIDDDSAGLVINDVTVNEEDGLAVFTITLNGNTFFGTTVTYETQDETAISAEDYSATSASVTFGPGVDQTRDVTIPILDDFLLENDETFFVNLVSSSSPFITIIDNLGIGTIVDDDNCIAAPILDTSVSNLFCDVIDRSLNDFTQSTPPAGNPNVELRWSRNSDPLNENAYLLAAEVANPPNAGSFYGFFLDNNGTPNNFNDDCASSVIEVEIILNVTPTIISASGGERCGSGTVLLSAEPSDGASINWYTSIDADTPVASGNTFTTPVLNATRSYFVEATENGCVTERQEVIALVGFQASAGVASNASVCNIAANGPTILDLDDRLVGEGAGVWTVTTDPSQSITIPTSNIIDFRNLAAGAYVFTFTTTNSTLPCQNVSVDITISVSDCETDDDGDGLFGGEEATLGTDPADPDTDGDGIDDGTEVGPDVDNPLDEDEDGIIDALESNILDADNDGVNDQQDPANNNPCLPNRENGVCDFDGDDIPDSEEIENGSDPDNPCDPNPEHPNCLPIDLQVLKEVDNVDAAVGDTVIFTITLNNLDTDREAVEVIVGDLLGLSFDYVSSSPSVGTYSELSGEWFIPEIGPAATATLDITATVTEDGDYLNTAEILASLPIDDSPNNNTASVQLNVNLPEGIDLSVEKTVDNRTPLVGEEITFTIAVLNQSQNGETITNIEIMDMLDQSENADYDIIFIQEDNLGTYNLDNGLWQIPLLSIQEQATLRITVRVLNEVIFANTATYISSSPADSNPDNNQSTAEVNVNIPNQEDPGFLYNQFSPNGDRTNDILRINLRDYETGLDSGIVYKIEIYDRYGSLVFKGGETVLVNTQKVVDVWDGTYEGKEAPKGTYFYVMNYSINNEPSILDKGWIQLIR